MKRTELDDWATDWMNTQLFNLTIMGGDFPGVEAIYRAGFERAVKEMAQALVKTEGDDLMSSLRNLGQGPARDDQR